MKPPKDTDFRERQKASINAKQALLERFKTKPAADDPEVAARRAERAAIAAARAEREAVKEAARRAAEEQARVEAEARKEAERLAAIQREAERKAEEERLAALRPRKVLMDAIQYAEMRAQGKKRA